MSKYASAILTIVGTVVGAYFGGPIGASLGATLGALVGGLAFPQNTSSTGPRLADITSTNSSVGAAIPRGWGTFATAGNIIAQSDLREVMVTTGGGGKGAPSTSTTTPTYYQDFAVLLTDTGDPANQRTVKGFRTIWANGKPIYDRRPRMDGETDAAYQSRLAASDALDTQIAFYHGDEEQLPDPTLEAFYGVGNITAFRGCCYIVFINWQNKPEDGNRMPSSWLFELYTDGDETGEDLTEYTNEYLLPWIVGAEPPMNPYVPDQYTYTASNGGGDGIPHAAIGVALATFTPSVTGLSYGYVDYVPVNHLGSLVTRMPTSKTDEFIVGSDADVKDPKFIVLNYNAQLPQTFLPSTDTFVMGNNVCDYINQTPTPPMPIRFGGDNTVYGLSGACGGACDTSWYVPATLHARGWEQITSCGGPIGGLGGHGFDWLSSFDRFVLVTRVPGAPPDPCDSSQGSPAPMADGSVPPAGPARDPTLLPGIDGFVLINGEIRKCGPWAKTAGTWKVLQATTTETHTMSGGLVNTTNYTKYPLGPARPIGHAEYADAGFWTDAYEVAVARKLMPAGLTYGIDYPVAQAYAYQRTLNQKTIVTLPAVVSDVTAELCLECGYQRADFDVTLLESMTVQGFIRTGSMAGRAALTPLAQAKFFDGVESEGVIKFVPRGAANTFTLQPSDDLGCVVAGADQIPQVTITRADETDLPRSVTVTYLSPSRDYGAGSQISPTRIQTSSVNDLSITLPMVLSDDEAKAIATRLWAIAWTEAFSYASTVDGARQELEATDCGTLPVDGLNQRVRITAIADSLPITRGLTMVRDDSLAYTPTPVSSAPPFVPTPIKLAVPADALYLDLPALTDTDSDPGFYVAFRSELVGGYRGAALFRSIDNGSSYSQVCAATNEATTGVLIAAPTDADWDTWDGGNEIRVEVMSGSFSSATDDAVLAGANALAVGADGRWEILQFKTATNLSGDVWSLTGLLRGRRGTEHNIATAVAGDAVVLVSGPGIVRASLPITGVGRDYLYRSVAALTGLDGAVDDTFAGHAEALKPFSPADFQGAQDLVSNLWTLSWIRRGRIGQTMASGVDVALSEDSENYEVDILAAPGGAVLRTISSSVPNILLDANQQVALFGAVQTTLAAIVYQLSAQVGRGYGTAGGFARQEQIAPGTQVSTAVVTFAGTPTAAETWVVSLAYRANTGGAAENHTFEIAGGSPNGVEVHGADLAAQVASALGPKVVVTRVLGAVTITSTTGVLLVRSMRHWPIALGACSLYPQDYTSPPYAVVGNAYRIQDSHAAQSSTEGFYGVDLYQNNGAFAPSSDSSYNPAGTYTKRLKIRNVDADLNLAFLQQHLPPSAIVAGDYCSHQQTVDILLEWFLPVHTTGNRSIVQLFGNEGTGNGIDGAAAANSILAPLLASPVAVTGNRPCVEIVLLDGWELVDDANTLFFGDPQPSGWTALTSTLVGGAAVKAYPAGRSQIDQLEWYTPQDPISGLPLSPQIDIDTTQTFRITINGVTFDHAVDSTDLLDVAPFPDLPHFFDRIYGDLAAQINASGNYLATLVERDGRTGSPSAWVQGLSIKSKPGVGTYTFTPTILPAAGMTVTVTLDTHRL